MELKIPGETYFPGTGQKVCCEICGREEAVSGKELSQKSYTKCFDYDIIKSGLCIRYRRPGDELVIDSRGKRQKLKSYFINEKVPKEKRDLDTSDRGRRTDRMDPGYADECGISDWGSDNKDS